MFQSFRIGAPFGVEVKVHGTLVVLVAVMALGQLFGGGLQAAMMFLLMSLLVFASVTLHELGHIAAAALFGIGTTGLTLYPIGGIARLTREARSATEEVVVALAGPLVNIVLASFGALVVVLFGGGELSNVFIAVNLVMAIFNLLPAYPMDGGRVLKGVLWRFKGRAQATEWAARAGQWGAGLLGVAGLLYGQITLLFIAGFIYLQATAERRRVTLGSAPGSRVEVIPAGASPGYRGWPRPAEQVQASYVEDARGARVVYMRTPWGGLQRWEL
jgi:Zn-dependent protease